MEKSFNFSIKIIELYKKLIYQKEYIISKQLLRSATSIGANIMESKFGISKTYFLAPSVFDAPDRCLDR